MRSGVYNSQLFMVHRVQSASIIGWQETTCGIWTGALLTKVWDLHQAMFRVNADFTTPHKYSSRPESWPFVLKGVAYFQSLPQYTSLTEHTSQIYFLGNVTTYILSFIVVIIAMVKLAFYTLRNFNPYVTYLDSEAKRKFYANALQHVAGWALHYLPYFSFIGTFMRTITCQHYTLLY